MEIRRASLWSFITAFLGIIYRWPPTSRRLRSRPPSWLAGEPSVGGLRHWVGSTLGLNLHARARTHAEPIFDLGVRPV
ncbi:hypothetical protein GUJ93_ZPchr0002g26774 [Zizania palustris]|uniref:Uncharacterized protein n=1 Tax=Zizania palustris TaxID=103762 RepID=A0A8J5RVP1_ZIZPA|nr:hypothetical protein GUJ93_ZPchr0002g26774 [Zizania palustris]